MNKGEDVRAFVRKSEQIEGLKSLDVKESNGWRYGKKKGMTRIQIALGLAIG